MFLTCNTFAQEYILNAKSSSISWTGKAAFNSYSLTGSIKAKEGKLKIENDTIKNLEVVINMKSIHHENKDLKKHLKNKDFFEVNKFEDATFILTKPSVIDDNEAYVVGNLKIKDKTHQKVVIVTLVENDNITLSFNTKLDRTKYGVTFNSPNFFKKMKENAIADEFTLKSELVFN